MGEAEVLAVGGVAQRGGGGAQVLLEGGARGVAGGRREEGRGAEDVLVPGLEPLRVPLLALLTPERDGELLQEPVFVVGAERVLVRGAAEPGAEGACGLPRGGSRLAPGQEPLQGTRVAQGGGAEGFVPGFVRGRHGGGGSGPVHRYGGGQSSAHVSTVRERREARARVKPLACGARSLCARPV